MTQEELEALLRGESQPEPDIALLIDIGRAARGRAAVRALSKEVLAADPFADDPLGDALASSDEGLKLAAASQGGTLPARYVGGSVQVLLTYDHSGRVVARLEAGEGTHSLEIAEQQIPLVLGQDVFIPDLGGPPSDLALRDERGDRTTLARIR